MLGAVYHISLGLLFCLLVDGALFAPFAILLVFDLAIDGFPVLVNGIVHVLAHATPQPY